MASTAIYKIMFDVTDYVTEVSLCIGATIGDLAESCTEEARGMPVVSQFVACG